jgi:hypothetical protein
VEIGICFDAFNCAGLASSATEEPWLRPISISMSVEVRGGGPSDLEAEP